MEILRQKDRCQPAFLEHLACEGRLQQGNWKRYDRGWKKTKKKAYVELDRLVSAKPVAISKSGGNKSGYGELW